MSFLFDRSLYVAGAGAVYPEVWVCQSTGVASHLGYSAFYSSTLLRMQWTVVVKHCRPQFVQCVRDTLSSPLMSSVWGWRANAGSQPRPSHVAVK